MAAILLVDDEPSLRTTLGLLLRRRGHAVTEADSVAGASNALAASVFDVVVTDLRMPDGLGLDVLDTVKMSSPEADVILLTAYPGWESAKTAMQLGALDYFEKGDEPDGLLQRIDRALEARVLRRRPVTGSTEPPRPTGEAERRYLTVLFADMRQSLELLAARDLDEARGVLDGVIERLMESVHWAGGTVNQVMGDGIMALFGVPVAHPDHAVRACRSALRMQAAVARYAADLRSARGLDAQIRVGINSGEVIVRAVGSDLRWDYTAVGQPTHIAARMEQLARPGAVVITAETLRQVGGAVSVRPLGPLAVKGLPDPVDAYELIAVHPTSLRPAPAPSA
ncbi:MAG TPA: adenylate/guanylate cyclase domain-containing protein [Methylomirabilota bacterium]|nr:adenylate/guanylate cyclase domain-containing protein [Methylomirabilota bacterium]